MKLNAKLVFEPSYTNKLSKLIISDYDGSELLI